MTNALLQPGMAAPDVSLLDSNGVAVSLARFWAARPLLIFFMRHFGCAACREHLFHIRDSYSMIQAHGAAVVAIAQHDPDLTARYAQTHQVPFPMLTDPTRQAYQAFGVVEGTYWETSGPQVIAQQIKLAWEGNVMGLPHSAGASRQLGGTFIVDTRGVIRFSHVARPIYNHPAVQTYLDSFAHL
jgi:peroxiredoxin